MPTIEISLQTFVRLGLYGSKNDSWDSILREIMDQIEPDYIVVPKKEWGEFEN